MASPSASSALVDFDQLATEAGAGDFLRRYLTARGSDRTATLALMAPTAERFAEIIIDPLGPGFVTAGEDEFKLTPAELPTARAVLTHMWEEARAQWNAWAAARRRPGPGSSGSCDGRHAAVPADGLQRPPGGRATEDLSYPPPGWGGGGARQDSLGHGPPPTSSTPSPPGVATRPLPLLSTSLVAEEKRPWQPKSVIAICDGLEAVKWAWILVQLGAEEDIESYIAWWDCRARGRNANLLALVSYWDSMAMRLAMDLRQRRTFKDAVTAAPSRPEGRTKGRPQPTQTSPDADDSWVEPPPKRIRPGRKGKKGAKGGSQGRPPAGAQGRQMDQAGPMLRRRRLAGDALRPLGVGRLGIPFVVRLVLGAARLCEGPAAAGVALGRPPGRKEMALGGSAGIGAAPWLVSSSFGRPLLAVSWEIDQACCSVASAAMPWLLHRGNLLDDSPEEVAKLIREADPNGEAMILGWPPLLDAIVFMDELRALLAGRRFSFLFESVVMSVPDAAVISDALGVEPVFVCSSDFGWVSRPRQWWLSVDWALVRTSQGRWSRLRLAGTRAADSFDLGGLVPCATTPAPTEDGSSPLGTAIAKLCSRTPRASFTSRLLPKSPDDDGKEATGDAPVPAVAQHAMSGLGVRPPLGGVALGDVVELLLDLRRRPVGSQTIEWLLGHWHAHGWDFAPPPRPDPPFLGDGLSEEEHWAAAPHFSHSLTSPPVLEPALEGVLQFRAHWRHDMVRIRHLVIQELEVMVHDAQEATASWLAARPHHVRATYCTEGGFDMLGEVRRAPGWKSREDRRYSNPAPIDRLRRENPSYVSANTRRPQDSEHTLALRDELVKEARLGRVMGPCRAPDGWGVTMASLPEAGRFVQHLIRVRSHRAPPALRRAAAAGWSRRWWGLLAVAVQRAVASTALGQAWPVPLHPRQGDEPPLERVLELAGPAAGPSRLPLRS
ncbi:unnamed protein product [Symbiodinium sp. CCMP2592]|nr:unnamed protein product [Symbiodinium sp. CCMP2592]